MRASWPHTIRPLKHVTIWPLHMRAPWPHTRLERDFSPGSMLPRSQRQGRKLSGSGNKAGSRNIPNRLACTWLCTHQCSALRHSQRPNPPTDPVRLSLYQTVQVHRRQRWTAASRDKYLEQPGGYLTPANPICSQETQQAYHFLIIIIIIIIIIIVIIITMHQRSEYRNFMKPLGSALT